MGDHPYIGELIAAAERAGAAIRAWRDRGSRDFELKQDLSPVSGADLEADRLIRSSLLAVDPAIPCVSEEGGQAPPRAMDQYWLIDPLDGTQDFLAGTDEFCVSIARIEGGKVVLGVIHAPMSGLTYFGVRGLGAFRCSSHPGRPRQRISTRQIHARAPLCLISRQHQSSESEALRRDFPGAKVVAMGSALKFCRVAEGSADVYLRSGPTHPWDIAAGHCIVEQAGGIVRSLSGVALEYRVPGALNPAFIVAGDRDLYLSHVVKERPILGV